MTTVAYGDRVRQTTTTTGTGNLSLDPQPDIRWRTFVDELGTGDFIQYQIEVDGTGQWENGHAQIIPGTPDQLVRYQVMKTSAGNTLPIDLPAGTHIVTSGVNANLFAQLDFNLRNQIIAGDFHYEATDGFKIDPGNCTIDGLDHIWPTALAGPGVSGHTANTLHYVYLYNQAPGNDVPAVEVSTVAAALHPANRYWAKGADSSRRLIGFFSADIAGVVHPFIGARNDAQLTVFYEQNVGTLIWDGQSTAAWSEMPLFQKFAPVGTLEVTISVEMVFSAQNNANKIGIDPTDHGTGSVEQGIYRQAFNANKDVSIIEDSLVRMPIIKAAPALWTRNTNNNGSTDYIVTMDAATVNLRP